MKFTSVVVVLASAVAVSAQGVSSLPQCALLCSVQATGATTCGADVACSCQPANQALIAAQLLPCLQANCSASDAALGIQIGQAVCASAAPSSAASAPATSSAVPVVASSSMPAAMTSSSMPAVVSSSSVPVATLVAVSSSTVLTTAVSTVTPTVAASQLSDGQIQAATSTKPVVISSVSAQTTVVAYTGNGAMATAAPVALAGLAAVAAALF